jgi:hypothetical protein
MNQSKFSWIALGIGGFVALLLLRFGPSGGEEQALPLLTSLFLAEFGFLVSAAGAYLGYRSHAGERRTPLFWLTPLACLLLALGFAWLGLTIWSQQVAIG